MTSQTSRGRGRHLVRALDRRRIRALAGAPWRRAAPAVSWLFVATLPNSGSTAFARVLSSAPRVTSLNAVAEGQWIVPELSGERRWDPDLEVDYGAVAALWRHRARRRAPRGELVIEKSPPNICRMPALLDAFAADRPRVVTFTRDPVAVCASWTKRVDPDKVRRRWLPEGHPGFPDRAAYHRTLGRICGQRMQLLADLSGLSVATVTYEDLTDHPAETLGLLAASFPQLAEVDPSVSLGTIKDHRSESLRNMNAEQVASLDPDARAWIEDGLRDHAGALAVFGYTV